LPLGRRVVTILPWGSSRVEELKGGLRSGHKVNNNAIVAWHCCKPSCCWRYETVAFIEWLCNNRRLLLCYQNGDLVKASLEHRGEGRRQVRTKDSDEDSGRKH